MYNQKYWTSEFYGRGKQYRRLSFYPKSIPLYFYSQHGAYFHSKVAEHELETDSQVILFFSDKLKQEFCKKQTSPNKKCAFVVPDPFTFAKRKIVKKTNTMGTLFFWGHSTDLIENNIEIKDVLDELEKLPNEYHPVDICIHYHDQVKGLNEKLMNWKYAVVCAGNPIDIDYAENFYRLLLEYRYTSSNALGSYTCYSIDAGIPFFLYSKAPIYFNKGDKNLPQGRLEVNNSDIYRKGEYLFGYNQEGLIITRAQKEYVVQRIGKITKYSRCKLIFVTYFTLCLFFISKIFYQCKK
jgi:hypothetical protein